MKWIAFQQWRLFRSKHHPLRGDFHLYWCLKSMELLFAGSTIHCENFININRSPNMMSVRRCRRSWDQAWPGQLTQTIQRDIPYHNMACTVYKLGELARREWSSASVSGQWAMVLCIILFSRVLFFSLFHCYSFTIQYFAQLFLTKSNCSKIGNGYRKGSSSGLEYCVFHSDF